MFCAAYVFFGCVTLAEAVRGLNLAFLGKPGPTCEIQVTPQLEVDLEPEPPHLPTYTHIHTAVDI